MYIYIYIQSGLNKFLALLAGDRMMNLKINILTKKGFTNFDIFLYYYKFQKIRKTVLMAIAATTLASLVRVGMASSHLET